MLDDAVQKLFALAISQAEDDELRKELELAQSIELPSLLLEETEDEESNKNAVMMIRELNVAGRLKLALLGNLTARTVLIRDPNRQIQLFVLQNPRLSENEVHEFARNPNLDELVLRAISRDGQWMKNYSIKHGLVGNPKTPIDISLSWLKFLTERDLRILSKSKNVPQIVATQCRKLSEKRAK